MGRLVSIGEASQVKGVSVETLRKWEAEGKIKAVRTSGGHRRYDLTELMPLSEDNKKTIAYCRVSSHDQKADARTTNALLHRHTASLVVGLVNSFKI